LLKWYIKCPIEYFFSHLKITSNKNTIFGTIGEFMEKNSRALHVESNEPQSYREAMAMNKEKWLPAYQKEFQNF
jgi:hypothetical protein